MPKKQSHALRYLMHIERIETYKLKLPYSKGVYRLSNGREYRAFDSTIVHIICNNGLDGWGESTPFGSNYIAAHGKGVDAALEELAPILLGLDPIQTERINDALDAQLLGHNSAKAPLDVACWDIFGKAVGRPVCDLLGGRINHPVPLISSIGSDTPEAMRKNIQEHREQGFMGHSVKIGAGETEGGPKLDAERIQSALADRKPEEWFLADANGSLTPEQALRMLALLPRESNFVLEAPCASWRETLSLRQRCSVPIMLDELIIESADIIHAIQTDACDGIGIKITKQGGLTRSRVQRDLCISAGLVTSIQDTTGSEIAYAAVLHLAQSTPRNILRCALDTRSMTSLSTAHFDAPIKNGAAHAPNLPGLGIHPNLEVLTNPQRIWTL